MFYFHPENLGKVPILTSILFKGVETNHQLEFQSYILWWFFGGRDKFNYQLEPPEKPTTSWEGDPR